MLSQKIEKTSTGQFEITYEHLPEFKLALNFNPIIERFNLRGNFCLLHWQAKPFSLRRWGVYDAGIDEYFAATWNCIDININCNGIPLQIDETVTTTVPTAVIYFKASKIVEQNYLSIVKC